MKRSIINPTLLVLVKHLVIGQECVSAFHWSFQFPLLFIGHHLGSYCAGRSERAYQIVGRA